MAACSSHFSVAVMEWSELTVNTTTFGAELVSELFFEMGAGGAVVEDRSDVVALLSGDKVWDYVDDSLLQEADPVALVKGFVSVEYETEYRKELEARLLDLKNREQEGYSLGSLEVSCRRIDDEDWANVWKKHYRPLHFGRVVICPEWIDYRPQGNETVVAIDPGMAFGTGEHETTGMCIELMQRFCLEGKAVIDVGCGSGILGAAALRLGADTAYLVDFDPVAVTAARHNLTINGLEKKAVVKCGDLLEENGLQADFVFANITADVLLRLCRKVKPYVKRGGAILLSGLIHKRVDEVLAEYEAAGFQLVERMARGEWNAAALVNEG